MTKVILENLKKNEKNIVFKKDDYIMIISKEGDCVLSWFNEQTMQYVKDIKVYEELESLTDEFWKKFTEKKYAGLTPLEAIEKCEKENYTEHDKAVIAKYNNRIQF